MPTRRVGLQDFNKIAENERDNPLTIISYQQFADTPEETSEPLLGSADDTLLPANGMLLMYGDGGAGKTTLTIDAAAHLAAGNDWLGIPVDRPSTILMIENEGPRGKFRQRLAEKAASWNGNKPYVDNIHVLEEPWTRFTLADKPQRQGLADAIEELNIDILILGPLATIGMTGGGTPDEINVFAKLLEEVRHHTNQPFAYWIVHHENKAGDVSGAWERVPDTLVHIQAQGNGHTRLNWRKARWSSEHHGTNINLTWQPGRSFTVEEATQRDLHAEIELAFTNNNAWRTSKEVSKLIKANVDHVKTALADLVRREVLQTQIGPPGRFSTAICWSLKSDSAPLSHPESVSPLEGWKGETDSLTPPYKESESESVSPPSPQSDLPDPESPPAPHPLDPDQDIPF